MKFEYNIKSELLQQLSEIEESLLKLKYSLWQFPQELKLKIVEDVTDGSKQPSHLPDRE